MLKKKKFDLFWNYLFAGMVIFILNIAVVKAQSNYTSLHSQTNNYSTFSSAKKEVIPKSVPIKPTEEVSDMETLENTANEVIEKRTRNTKFYIDKSNPGKFIQLFSYGGNLNYLKDGKWLTASQKLKPLGNGIFKAEHQMEPVGFDVNLKNAFIETEAGRINFNQWNLLGIKAGEETILAAANWSNYTAGDDGIRIYNIFPGIDAEMRIKFGAIKTNFIIHKNHYTGIEKFIFRDDFNSTKKLGKLAYGQGNNDLSTAIFVLGKETVLKINKAIVYPEKNPSKNYKFLDYLIKDNSLSIGVDASYINSHLKIGNVIIDPLVEATGTLAQNQITGSMSCGSSSNYCSYNFNVPTPPKVTVTNVSFKWGIYVNPPVNKYQTFFNIVAGSCNVPFQGVFPRQDPDPNPGTGLISTNGNFVSVNPQLLSCLPAPSCEARDVPFELRFWNTYCGGNGGCSNDYVRADEPLVFKTEGYMLEFESITASQTICNGYSTFLEVKPKYGVPPYSYKWSNGLTAKSIEVDPVVATSYSVLVTDNCGNTFSANTEVKVDPTPVIQGISSNSPLCDGSKLVLNTPVILGATYKWTGPNNFTSDSPNPIINNVTSAQSGDYELRITVNGCTSFPETVNVDIGKPVVPIIQISSSVANVCAGVPVTFTSSIKDAGNNPSYQWQVNGINVGANSSMYTSNGLVDGDEVICKLSTTVFCTLTPIVKSNPIKVNPALVPSVSIQTSTASFCAGMPATFTANAVNCGNSPTYNWQINGTSLNNNSNTFTSSRLANGDIVSCIVNCDPIGCYTTNMALSNEIELIVNEIPKITITRDTTVFAGSTFALQGFASGNIKSYLWSPSTYLNEDNIRNPIITPLKTIQYTFQATNDANCIATQIVLVKVLEKIDIPNTFSPNGDGVNDNWVIKGLEDYAGATIDVYNRNGLLVYKSIKYIPWDGTYKGKLLSNGTYYYLINPKYNLPILSGWVNIVR